MIKKSILITTLILISCVKVNSQSTIILQPDSSLGKDAFFNELLSVSNTNYGSNPQFCANAWTFGGIPAIVRSVIDFNLSSIPNGAIIDSAYLSLYAWDSNNLGYGQHATNDGPNNCLLQRITSNWNEHTVNWNNKPTTTSVNQVIIPSSTSPSQDYPNIDVSSLVQDMTDNPSTSFGFLLKLNNETHSRRMNFASSDHDNNNLHPKLVVYYSEPTSILGNNIQNFEFNIFPNPASNLITVKLNNPQHQKFFLQIINATGQLISQKTNFQSNISFDVSDYSKGLYFVKVYSDNLVSTKKIIIE